MREEYYRIAPQMRDYHNVRPVFSPYMMEMDLPNYKSPSFSTDEFGFRTTIYHYKPLRLQDYSKPPFDGKRAALVGNSTVFGVGATSDASTIASLLNHNEPKVWFNFSGRVYQSTQELINYILFAPKAVEQVVILSGINNFDASYRCFNELNNYLPPFYSQRIYLEALSTYTNSTELPSRKKFWDYLTRTMKKIRLHTVHLESPLINQRNTFFPDSIRDQFFSNTQKLENILKDANCLKRSLTRFETDIQLWSAIFGKAYGAVTFILQPVPEWTCKNLSPEEEKLFKYVQEQRGNTWKVISDFLSDKGENYRKEVKEICKRNNVRFFDANEFSFLKDNEWIFLDRYHLTDRGQALIAQFIADNLII